MHHILALDQGTTGSTAIVFDSCAKPLSRVNREFPQSFPRAGWVEHDAMDLWNSALLAGREALSRAGVLARDLAAIGLTNQRETLVHWDRRSGEPTGPAIVWQDRRTAAACARLRADGVEPLLRARTGLLADPYFTGTKLQWLLEQHPGLRSRIHVGTVDTWLLHQLTGGSVHATDVSNASRTLLCNLATADWDGELLDLFGVPRELLPEIRPSSGFFGMAQAKWFGAEVPICGVAGDQQAALFAQAGFEPGRLKNTYGTGSFLLMNTGTEALPPPTGLLGTIAGQLEGGPVHYALEGSVFVAGAAVQWLRDGLGLIANAAETDTLARSVPDSGGVVFVPALTGLGAPVWDPEARGLICGLSRGSTRAHLVRATLEAIALQSLDLVQCMREVCRTPVSTLFADGGASANRFLMQCQADLLGIPVRVAGIADTTALGAACLAARQVGLWSAETTENSLPSERYEPGMDAARREGLIRAWRLALQRCQLGPAQ